MLLYLDTSAFLPLVVAEPGTNLCMRIWQDAELVTSSRLLIVESAAALAQAHRMGRLTTRQFEVSRAHSQTLIDDIALIEVTKGIVSAAKNLAVEHALRGYDAVHLASSLLVRGADSAGASGDKQLVKAWSATGLTVIST